MDEIKQVFASGVTLTFGTTYSRMRFLMENTDLKGTNEGDEVIADVVMSPQLMIKIYEILNDNIENIKKMSNQVVEDAKE